MHPAIIAGLITGGSGLLSSLFGGGKGKPVEMTSANPEMDKYRMELMQMAMQNMGQPQPYAQVNPMNLMGANMASQHYYGQPYTHPGYGMGQTPMAPPQGKVPQGMGGGPNMARPQGMPQYGQPKGSINFAR